MLERIKSYIQGIDENDKIVYQNSIVSFFLQMFSLLIGVVIVPAYIEYFCNSTVLGMWYAILSILNWIIDFDIGIGNGLKNHLTTALAEGKKDLVKSYISSAYFCYGLLSAVLFVPCLCFKNISFNSVLNVAESVVSAQSLTFAVQIIFVTVVLQFFLKLIVSIACALQKNSVNLVVSFFSSLLLLLFLLLCPTKSNEENIIAIAIFRGVSVILPLLVATIYIFKKEIPYALPKIKYINSECSKNVLFLGGKFFAIQIFYMLIIGTNEILITRFMGNEYNVDYQIYYKIFSIITIVFFLISVPLWSVVTKAKAEHNYIWLKSGYKKYMLLGLLFCVGSFILMLITKPIVNIWLGGNAPEEISFNITFWFALNSGLMVIIAVFSAFAMGLEKMKTQTICYIIGAALKLPLSKLLVEITGSWIGVVIATCICLCVYCIAEFVVLQKYFSRKEFKQA